MLEKFFSEATQSKTENAQMFSSEHTGNQSAVLILGGHVMQLKNKITNDSINQVKKMRYCRRV